MKNGTSEREVLFPQPTAALRQNFFGVLDRRVKSVKCEKWSELVGADERSDLDMELGFEEWRMVLRILSAA